MMQVREQLEEAILESPDDAENHAVYADWLQDQGDSRGEFIQVQLALEDTGLSVEARLELQARESELIAQHAFDWLGTLGGLFLKRNAKTGLSRARHGFEFTFVRGWLSAFRCEVLQLRSARRIFEAPQVRLLQSVSVYGEAAGDLACQALKESFVVPRFRELNLSQTGVGTWGVQSLLAWQGLSDLTRLDLSGNVLHEQACQEIKAACPFVNVADQTPPEWDDFYDGILE